MPETHPATYQAICTAARTSASRTTATRTAPATSPLAPLQVLHILQERSRGTEAVTSC
jgi:hypothetical protein